MDAAITVVERDGLAAVSMSRVAAELGASTMSLYRYVSAKDELLMLMADAAYGAPPSFRGPDDDLAHRYLQLGVVESGADAAPSLGTTHPDQWPADHAKPDRLARSGPAMHA